MCEGVIWVAHAGWGTNLPTSCRILPFCLWCFGADKEVVGCPGFLGALALLPLVLGTGILGLIICKVKRPLNMRQGAGWDGWAPSSAESEASRNSSFSYLATSFSYLTLSFAAIFSKVVLSSGVRTFHARAILEM